MFKTIDGVNQALEHKQGMARLDGQRRRLEVLKRAVCVILAIAGVIFLYSACHDEVTGRLIYWTYTGQGAE